MRIVLGLEYDGQYFRGWQSQPDGNTVQDTLEHALSTMAQHPVRLHAAGRTDRGVHATLQIAHFDTDAKRPLTAWVRGINSLLPPGIAVLWSHPVSEQFHARFCATGRRYRYLLLNHPVRPALMQQKVGWYHAPLNSTAMQQAAQHLVGEHDFSSFRAAGCQSPSPTKCIRHIALRHERHLLVLDIMANGFLYHMVRNIMGALIVVGRHDHDPDWLADLLAMRQRSCAPPTFMADGLYFAGAEYDPHWGLPNPTGAEHARHFGP